MTNQSLASQTSLRAAGRQALALCGAILLLATVLINSNRSAEAAATCTFDTGTSIVTVALPSDGDSATMSRDSTTGTFIVSGTSLPTTDCGGATTVNVNSVVVTGGSGNQALTLDLRSGRFEPGDDFEAGVSEIEFSIDLGNNGAAPGDVLTILGPAGGFDPIDGCGAGVIYRLGEDGVNVNNDLDADIVSVNDTSGHSVDLYVVTGGSGEDTISANGGSGTGAALLTPVQIGGQACNDVMTGGASTDDTVEFPNFVPATNSTTGVGVNLTIVAPQVTGNGQGSDTIDAIENIIGTGFVDTLTGNSLRNRLMGQGNSDTLIGLADDGTIGDDLRGGAGADTASYTYCAGPLIADMGNAALGTGQARCSASDVDKFPLGDVENISGTAANDTISGDENNNSLSGGGGNDTLEGRLGSDTLTPGPGNDFVNGGFFATSTVDVSADTVSFSGATAGITVDLLITTSQVIGADQGSDTITQVENVNGSDFADVIDGSNVANALTGRDGDDVINGRGGGDVVKPGPDITDNPTGDPDDDRVSGGPGIDTVDFDGPGAVIVDMLEGTAMRATNAETDIFVGFENVNGSSAGDVISGDNGPNVLAGLGGNDNIEGRLGNDTVIPGQGNDNSSGGTLGDATSDPTGIDTLSFIFALRGVTADLSNNAGQMTGDDSVPPPTPASTDSFSLFENLTGGAFNDTLTGSAVANLIVGGDGNDTLNAGDGNDILSGGAGNDSLNGGAGNDLLSAGPGNDTLNGGANNDIENGDDGNDLFNQEATANGADQLNGGPPAPGDIADYSLRTVFVNVTPDGAADDGATAELDNIGTDVDEIYIGQRRLIPLTPARILDTRIGTGTGGSTAPVGPGAVIEVQVTGTAGVPATGVSAVVLNVTVTSPTAPSHLTVWPKGTAQPTVSNLNFVPGQTVANLVMVKVGDQGKVSIGNHAGSVHVIADVAGYYNDPSVAITPAGQLQTLPPARILDTRNGTGGFSQPIGPGQTITVQVAGQGGVPMSGATAVAANFTITSPNAPGHLTIFPTGEPMPIASNLNFVPGLTVANFVVVKLGTGAGLGKIDIFNAAAGTVHVIADTAGWYSSADTSQGEFQSIRPSRILDTRSGQGGFLGALAPGASIDVTVVGVGGVPLAGVTAVALNATITDPTAEGHLTIWPTGTAEPVASNLNWTGGRTVPNFTAARVGTGGKVSIRNTSVGGVQLILDTGGWFSA